MPLCEMSGPVIRCTVDSGERWKGDLGMFDRTVVDSWTVTGAHCGCQRALSPALIVRREEIHVGTT